MRLFHDRPLAALTAVFAAVSVAAFYMTKNGKLALAAVIAVAVAVIFLLSSAPFSRISENIRAFAVRRRAFAAALSFFAAAALAVSFVSVDVLYTNDKKLDGVSVRVTGYVLDTVSETSYASRYSVVLTKVGDEGRRIGALLDLGFAAELSVGDEFTADVTFEALGTDGGFDEEAYYLPRGVRIKAVSDDPGSVHYVREHAGVDVFAAKLRGRISARIGVSLEEYGGNGIAEALLVGGRDDVDDEVIRDFAYIGAMHLLAISGLHLSIIIGGLDMILTRFMSKTPRSLILIFLTLAYMTLTGFPASVTRAGLMLIIYYASHFARRGPDSVTSLFFAFSLILLVSPMSAGDVSLMLSVTAMLGCIFGNKLFFTERMRAFFYKFARRGVMFGIASRICKYVYTSLAISVSALMFTLPVVWLSFGRMSLLSPLAALIMTPVITPILYLSAAIAIFFGAGWLTSPLSALCGILCRAAAFEASALAGIDGASVSLSSPHALTVPLAAVGVAAVSVCLIFALISDRRCAVRALSAAALVLAITAVSGAVCGRVVSADSVDFYGKGKNDVVVASDGARTLVCDFTDGSWSPISTALSNDDPDRVDVFMLTHLHRRHADTFGRLCRREYVRELWLPMPETDDETVVYRTLLDIAEYYGVSVTPYERGDTLAFGSFSVETIRYSMLKRSTHPVVAVSFDTDAGKTVYIGSSIHESEAYESAVGMCADADCVIFGIHGPVYKSGAAYFLTPGTRIIYANIDAADYLIDYNNIGEFEIFGE